MSLDLEQPIGGLVPNYEIQLLLRTMMGNNLPIYDENLRVYFSQCSDWATEEVTDEYIVNYFRTCVALILNGGKPFVVTKSVTARRDNYHNGDEYPCEYLMRPFNQWCKHIMVLRQKYDPVKERNVPIKVPLHKVLENHWHNLQWDNIGFIPFSNDEQRKDISPRIFNTFTGFKGYTSKVEYTDEEADEVIDFWLNHLKLLCGNEKRNVREFFLGWLADIVQRPDKKSTNGICPVIRSQPGSGKNIFVEHFGNFVLGPQYTYVCNDLEQVTRNFNAIIENVIFCILDEVQNYGGNFKSNDKLKNIITQSEITIENKGLDSRKAKNFTNYIMLSNNDWVVKVEALDRRFFCINASTEMRGNTEYFDKFDKLLRNEKAGKIIFDFLSDYDLSNWSNKAIPETSFRTELKERSRHHIWDFLEFLFDKDECSYNYEMGPKPVTIEPNHHYFVASTLFGLYIDWVDKSNIHKALAMSRTNFKRELEKIHKSNPDFVNHKQKKWLLSGKTESRRTWTINNDSNPWLSSVPVEIDNQGEDDKVVAKTLPVKII